MQRIPSALPTSAVQQNIATRTAESQRRLEQSQAKADGVSPAVSEQLEEFASLLILQMLQTMRRTVPKSGVLDTGMAHDLYMSLFDQEIAGHMARRRDLGLTSLLEQHFPASPATEPQAQQKQQALAAYRQQQHIPARAHDAAPQIAGARFHPEASASWRFDKLLSPVSGPLSSPYGWRPDPFDGAEKWHDGIDIAAPAGAVVRAAAAGEVVFSGTRQGYGNLLIVEHEDGYQTFYGHNGTHLVPAGTVVHRGQPIATVGQTGRATGPHVHFEVRHHGQTLDPRAFLAETLASKRHE